MQAAITIYKVAYDLFVVWLEYIPSERSNKLDLGAKVQPLLRAIHIQRLFRKAIPRKQQRTIIFVIIGKGPHAFACIQRRYTFFLQQPEQYLGIAGCAKRLSPGGTWPQFKVIVNLPVVNQRLAVSSHRLIGSCIEIKYRQS